MYNINVGCHSLLNNQSRKIVQKVLNFFGDFSVVDFSWRGTDEQVCNFQCTLYQRYGTIKTNPTKGLKSFGLFKEKFKELYLLKY